MRLKDKVALITGAGSGIGRESALLFAREGAAVVVVDVERAGGAETVGTIAKNGGAQLRQRRRLEGADCETMVAAAEQRVRQARTCCSTTPASCTRRTTTPSPTDEAVWDLTMDVNAKGVFLGCKYGIPALRRAGGGSIINTASFVARMGAATPQIAYTASKGAVLAMTRELAVIHARENIRVNALCPGPLKTELLMSFLNTEEKKQRRLVHIPMGRFGEARGDRQGRAVPRLATSRPTSPAPSSWSTAASPPPTSRRNSLQSHPPPSALTSATALWYCAERTCSAWRRLRSSLRCASSRSSWLT